MWAQKKAIDLVSFILLFEDVSPTLSIWGKCFQSNAADLRATHHVAAWSLTELQARLESLRALRRLVFICMLLKSYLTAKALVPVSIVFFCWLMFFKLVSMWLHCWFLALMEKSISASFAFDLCPIAMAQPIQKRPGDWELFEGAHHCIYWSTVAKVLAAPPRNHPETVIQRVQAPTSSRWTKRTSSMRDSEMSMQQLWETRWRRFGWSRSQASK